MAELFTVSARINLDQSGYTEGLRDAEGKGRELAGKLSGWSNAVSVAVGNMISGAVSKVGSFLKNAVTSSIQTGAQFDTSMAQVAATMGKTVDQVQDLARFARQMGASTSFSASEAADALNYMALAGYDAQTSMKMLPNVLNLAAAGGIALASASDMVTDAASALGLTIDETATMVDQMAVASSKTNTSVAQLGEAILAIGGTAQMISGGTNELATSLGILADNGIKGAEGGTHLRNIILALVSPTDTAAEALNKLGIQVTDSSGEMRAMKDVFSDLGKAMENMSSSEKAQLISTIFNKTDIAAVNALLGTNYERWEEIEAALNDASGAAERMAGTQLDNLNGDLKIFDSALDEAKISIAEGVTPALRSMVQYGTDVVTRLTKAYGIAGFRGLWIQLKAEIRNAYNMLKTGLKESDSAPLQFIGSVLEGIEAAFGWISEHGDIVISVITGIGAAFAAIKIQEFIGSLGSIKTAVSALVSGFNPWLLVIAAVAAGAALIIQNWDAVKAWFIQAGDTIVNAWNSVVSFLSQPFSMEFEIPDWNTVVTSIHDWWTGSVWPAIQDFFKTTFGVELPDWDKIVSDISNWWDGVWASIQEFFKATFGIDLPDWDEVVENVSAWWSGVVGSVEDACKWFLGLFGIDIGEQSVGEAISSWWSGVKSAAQGALDWVIGLFTSPTEGQVEVGNAISAWWKDKKQAAQDALDWVIGLFKNPAEGIKEVKERLSAWWEDKKQAAQNALDWTLKLFNNPAATIDDVKKKVAQWWGTKKLAVINACDWALKLFNVPAEKAEEIKNKVGIWWARAGLWVQSACNWVLKLFQNPVEALNEIQDHIGGWWRGVVNTVVDACAWVLKLFGVPTETIDTISTTVKNWWDGVVSSVVDVCKWTLRLFDNPSESAYKIGEIIGSWFSGIKQAIVDACKWVLSIGDNPNAESQKQSIVNWWNRFIKGALLGLLNFTLGLFGLPSAAEMRKKIEDWWNNKVIKGLNLVYNAVVRLFTGNDAKSPEEARNEYIQYAEQQNPSPSGSTSSGGRTKHVTTVGSGGYIREPAGGALFNLPGLGNNAKGLDFVPYNDYLTRLHFGEAILTRTEAQDWRESGGSKQEDSSMVLGAINALTDALKNLVLEADGQAIGRLAARYGASEIGGAIATMSRQTRTGYGV